MYADRLNKKDYVVRPVSLREAVCAIRCYHYAKSASRTAVYAHGLFHAADDDLILGAAIWLPPTLAAAKSVNASNPNGVLSLSRLALSPVVPKNGSTFLLGKSMKLVDRKRWPTLLTYADTWQNHTGTIYKACNWEYLGQTEPTHVFTREGKVVSKKVCRKTFTVQQMIDSGAVLQGRFPKHKFVHRGTTDA